MELAEIITRVNTAVPGAIVPTEDDAGFIQVEPKHWLKVAQLLKDDPELRFDSLMCITGVDEGPEGRLWAAYNLHSMELLHKLEVRIFVNRKNGSIPSVANLWRTADWHEREAYDLIGIKFKGHPDFRRILLPYDWEGHPLRKDFETPDYYRGMPVPKDKRGWE